MFWLIVFSPIIVFSILGLSGAFHSLNDAYMFYTIAAFGVSQALFIAAGIFYEAIYREKRIEGYSKPRKIFYYSTWFPVPIIVAIALLILFVRNFI